MKSFGNYDHWKFFKVVEWLEDKVEKNSQQSDFLNKHMTVEKVRWKIQITCLESLSFDHSSLTKKEWRKRWGGNQKKKDMGSIYEGFSSI